jgi:hypothetical protein
MPLRLVPITPGPDRPDRPGLPGSQAARPPHITEIIFIAENSRQAKQKVSVLKKVSMI